MSNKFNSIQDYFNSGLWSELQLQHAVHRGWITSAEYKTLTNKDYVNLTTAPPTTLPEVTSADNGKVIKVVEGEWAKANEEGSSNGNNSTSPEKILCIYSSDNIDYVGYALPWDDDWEQASAEWDASEQEWITLLSSYSNRDNTKALINSGKYLVKYEESNEYFIPLKCQLTDNFSKNGITYLEWSFYGAAFFDTDIQSYSIECIASSEGIVWKKEKHESIDMTTLFSLKAQIDYLAMMTDIELPDPLYIDNPISDPDSSDSEVAIQ